MGKARKNIFAIVGSASNNSSNQKLLELFAENTIEDFEVTIYNDLKTLPHFDPELSINETPTEIIAFRNAIMNADGILICTPEYVFSVPSGLKNALEWCVSTTIFSEKPVGIITASAHGQKGHEELALIIQTLGARMSDDAKLLIRGIKGKINDSGKIFDKATATAFEKFITGYKSLVK